MSAENLIDSIKENLNGKAGQPMLLGVCQALAKRFGREPWLFRAVAIALALFYTGLALAAYVILGLALNETEARTRGVFKGLFISIRECVERLLAFCRDLFDGGDGSGGRAAR